MRDPLLIGPGAAGSEPFEPDSVEASSRGGEPPSRTFARGAAVGALAVGACFAAVHAKQMRIAHYRAVLLTLDAEDADATSVLDAARTVVDSVASHLWCCTIALSRPWARFDRTPT